METTIFLGGLVMGLVIGWFILALLTFAIIKRRKRTAGKFPSRLNAKHIPFILVTLMLFGN